MGKGVEIFFQCDGIGFYCVLYSSRVLEYCSSVLGYGSRVLEYGSSVFEYDFFGVGI